MLFLVGLMGLMAVGASALYGVGGTSMTEEYDPDTGYPVDDEFYAESAGAKQDVPDLLMAEEPDVFPEPPQSGGIVSGGTGDDIISGSPDFDQINGYEGDDRISGAGSGDNLLGAEGDDTILGEDGDDTIHGGPGFDALFGGNGDDQIYGHGEDDLLHGDDGDDSLVGSEGNDTLFGGDGDDALHGDLGDDTLEGGAGEDTLFGGWGDDVINGVPEAGDDGETDFLNGGGGDDLIVAGAGDVVTSGEGSDTIALGDWLTRAHEAHIVDFTTGEDSLMLVYDDVAGEMPEVSVEADDSQPGTHHVIMNGVRIALVSGAQSLTLDDIVLVGQSTLQSLTAA